MAKKKKTKRKSRPIVTGHIEKVGRGIFDKYQKQITEMIKGHHGVYALYRKNKLYYIGLATNLKRRIKQHLNDKHGNSWTHFSLYIFKKADQIRELEALLLRIAYPEGNSQKGKLKGSEDMRPVLKQKVKAQQSNELDDLFKGHKATKAKTKKKTTRKKKTVKGDKPLKGYFKKRTRLYAIHKGYEYRALVSPTGTVKYDGTLYNSPSGAGAAARNGKATNGWSFWKYKDKNGNLVKLSTLRK